MSHIEKQEVRITSTSSFLHKGEQFYYELQVYDCNTNIERVIDIQRVLVRRFLRVSNFKTQSSLKTFRDESQVAVH